FSVSDKVKKLCKIYNLPVEVTKIGFKYICEIMQREDVLLGGEESGGIAVKGHIPERDGIWDGLLIIEHLATHGTTLEKLIQEVYDLVGKFSYSRLDLHLEEEKKQQILQRCASGAIRRFDDLEISRVEDLDGWKFYLSDEETVMIRASGTEPLLRIYAEAATPERVEEILIKAKHEILA
ncbi:MAG: phosphoglucomutase/phosphomannomutase family protein, partial [Chitinophagales bacterium]|nr:phosphoglucomutase/phosphomannomutase family protein [Chitinophagales bacterium]